MRAPHCEVHIFDPTLDPAEVQEVEAVDRVEFHDFGLGHRDQRVWRSYHRLPFQGALHACNHLAQADCLCALKGVIVIYMRPTCPFCCSERAHQISCDVMWCCQVAIGPARVMNRPVGGRLVQLHSLETIMAELGHSWGDVLKVDIEGFEWGVLEALVGADEPLPFTQLQARIVCPGPVHVPVG